MEVLENYFQEKLAVVETCRELVRGDAAANQTLLLEVNKDLLALRADIEEKRREVASMKHQLQAAQRLMTLVQSHSTHVRDSMANIPPIAAKRPTAVPTSRGNSSDQQAGGGQAKQQNVAPAVVVGHVAYLTLNEFESIPSYMKGRAQYTSLNVAIDELNTALEEKYNFLAKPFTFYTALPDKKRYKLLRSQETKDTKGVYFLTAEELKNSANLKSETNRRLVLTILRHHKRIREIRGPGGLVRFAVIKQN